MRSLSGSLLAAVAAAQTTFCYCWKITRSDNQVFGYTSASRDITFGGVTYEAATGFLPYQIETSAGLAVDNTEVEGVLTSASLEEDDLMAGLWDHATVEVFLLDHQNPTEAITLSKGKLGNVRFQGGRFFAEVRGLTQHYSANIGDQFSPRCRAILGDAKCGIDLDQFRCSATVTEVTLARRAFVASVGNYGGSPSQPVTDPTFFNLGTVRFLTGQNAGFSKEVRTGGAGSPFLWSQNIMLQEPMFYDIEVGDTMYLYAGCNKSMEMCIQRFANLLNFRGEPFVPGPPRLYGNNP